MVDYFGYLLVNALDLLDQIRSFGHDFLLLIFDNLEIWFVIIQECLLTWRDLGVYSEGCFNLLPPIQGVFKERLFLFLFGFPLGLFLLLWLSFLFGFCLLLRCHYSLYNFDQ